MFRSRLSIIWVIMIVAVVRAYAAPAAAALRLIVYNRTPPIARSTRNKTSIPVREQEILSYMVDFVCVSVCVCVCVCVSVCVCFACVCVCVFANSN